MSKLTFVTIILLMLACFSSALAVVYMQHSNRQLFVLTQQQKKQIQELQTYQGRLRLEQSAWASYGRVETKAAQELGMHAPSVEDLQFLFLN